MKKILIFTRPFTNSFTSLYKKYAEQEGCDVLYVSDFKYKDDVDLVTRQYKFLKKLNIEGIQLIDDIDNIIERCRFLRNIQRDLAVSLVTAASLAIEEVLSEVKPDFYIGLPIDNYILHLLHLKCNARGVINISPVQSFLPDRTRITSLGENIKCRFVSDEEVDYYFNLLNKESFRPIWLNQHRSFNKLVKLYIKERLKKIYFEIQKVIKRDPYSFHYNTIYPAKGVITIEKLSNLFAYKKYEKIDSTNSVLEKRGIQKIAYLPLQFSPETTIDYYIKDYRFSRYSELIDAVIASIPEDVILIVKEHPDLYGFRNIKFYENLKSNKKVHLAAVNYPTSEILKHVDAVIVTGGGSTGAEAIARGVKTVSLGGCFYSGIESLSINDYENIHQWPEVFKINRPTEIQRKNVVKRILQNTLVGPYDFVRAKFVNGDRVLENINNVVSYLIGK